MASTGEKSYILDRNRRNQQENYSPESTDTMNDLKELVDRNETDQSTLPSASYNYINSIIGSGVIGMPFAMQQAGFGVGFLLLMLVAVVTDYSLVLMVRGAHLAGVFSYQGLMEAAFGSGGFLLLSLLQFIYPFIAMISYNVVVGDTLTRVFTRVFGLNPASVLARREVVIGLATFLVSLPLCLYRDIAKLAKVSLFSLVCVAIIMVTIFIKFFMLYDVVPRSADAWDFANVNIVPAIGVMTFAFMCHHNTFLLYTSIQGATQERWDKVTHIALTASFLISAFFAVVGYGTFTGYSQGDLLENYCWNDDLMNMARFFFSITILLTFPIECFVTREVLNTAIFPNFKSTEEATEKRHYLTTTAILLITYFLSMTTDCLGVTLELNGVLAAVPLAYILPGLCYLRLEPSKLLSREKAPAIGLVVFGLSTAVIGMFFVIGDFGEVNSCSHGKIMDWCVPNSTRNH